VYAKTAELIEMPFLGGRSWLAWTQRPRY